MSFFWKGESWRQKGTEGRYWGDTEKVAIHKRRTGVSQLSEGQPSLLRSWFWTSGLQNCRTINGGWLSHLHFVTAVPANEDSWHHLRQLGLSEPSFTAITRWIAIVPVATGLRWKEFSVCGAGHGTQGVLNKYQLGVSLHFGSGRMENQIAFKQWWAPT